MQPGEVLEGVVAEIDGLIEPVALAADNICGNAMEVLFLCQLKRAPDQRIRGGLDIGVDEQYVLDERGEKRD